MNPLRDERRRRWLLPGIDARRLRAGHYSDAYFLNAARILDRLASAGEPFAGSPLALRGGWAGTGGLRPGDAEVELQFFARQRPRFVAAGIGAAIAVLRAGVRGGRGAAPAGSGGLRILAVPEGSLVRPLEPVLAVRGRYRTFAHLETVVLGILTRASRVATNVYEALQAARGKPIMFFPARFDLPQAQAMDGFAYHTALDTYARRTGRRVEALISTDAQGALWGGSGGGTMPHAYVLCFLGDTAEAMAAYCRHLPPEVPRIALVDTTNDCVGETLRTARRMFATYLDRLRAGRRESAERFRLHGVRADTAEGLRDRSVPRSADPRLERGVTPVLARALRAALDGLAASLPLERRWRSEAERYFRGVRIVASGGFDVEKIRFFEARRAPVDIYGLGSRLLRGPANDYTADLVRLKIAGRFRTVAKSGRGPRRGPLLRPAGTR